MHGRSYFGRSFSVTTTSISARMLEFTMNGIGVPCLPARSRLALIAAGAVALLGWFATPAQAQEYDGYYNPCSYRCGYPAYRYYPRYRYYHPYRHYGCYSCGSHLVYERRYVEREYVERRYGYGGYRHYYRHYPYYGYGRNYGYYPDGGYRAAPVSYGYGGVGRRWALPYLSGYGAGYGAGYDSGYEEPPRPPAPIYEPEY
jgi:hypothetical protein